MIILKSEQEMLDYGSALAKNLKTPLVIELIGDVGAGKTTLTRGIAKGLGIEENVSSPSFTISRSYHFFDQNQPKTLVHYDFYRLNDPGIMQEDLLENINSNDSIVIIEWANTVGSILPDNRITISIQLNDDNTRSLEISSSEKT